MLLENVVYVNSNVVEIVDTSIPFQFLTLTVTNDGEIYKSKTLELSSIIEDSLYTVYSYKLFENKLSLLQIDKIKGSYLLDIISNTNKLEKDEFFLISGNIIPF